MAKGKKSKNNNQYKTSKSTKANATKIKDEEASRMPPTENTQSKGQAVSCVPPNNASRLTDLQEDLPPKGSTQKDQAKTSGQTKARTQNKDNIKKSSPPKASTQIGDKATACLPPKAASTQIGDHATGDLPPKANTQVGDQATSSLHPEASTEVEDQATACSNVILPPEATMKHPLENTWSFWFFTNVNKKNWIENLVDLTNFSTAEDYWCLYHAMKCPSELSMGQDYAVFKKGISPMWEDASNKAGGRWFLNLDKRAMPLIDTYWLDVVLLMIGENFENSNEAVCGAVVNIRPRSKISLWTRTTDEQVNMTIARIIKAQLKIHFKLQYCIHNSNNVLYYC